MFPFCPKRNVLASFLANTCTQRAHCTNKQRQTEKHGCTDPVRSCHLHNDPNSRLVEEASISTDHHRGALAVPQIDGGEDTLDEVVQVVLPGLEHIDHSPQATAAVPLVRIWGGGYGQHLQRTVVHCCRLRVQPCCNSMESQWSFCLEGKPQSVDSG